MLFRSFFAIAIVAACPAALAQIAPKAPEPATLKANAEMAKTLPFADRQDFDDAMKGFVGTVPDALVPGTGQRPPVWSMKPYEFLKQEGAADSVNPSLWRQAQLNAIHGLFKVTERVYQVRGFDIANMTIVEGDTGLILVDTLGSPDTARAALDLYYQHRPKRPVGAVIYTHSHADHFGGARGVTSEDDVAAGKVQVLAPAGFTEAVAGEIVLAGSAMSRRAQYQFGIILPPGPRGHVDTGLGKTVGRAPLSLIAPTATVERNETRTIDGVEIAFHMAPGSEAPAEMLIYFPQFRVLDMAEDVNHTMHNLYTMRGSEVRDGNLWSRYIGEALDAFGDRTDVVIGQHTWPVPGQARVVRLLKTQRDLYKFINDQSLRLLNHGYTPAEIAETLHMPASLEQEWSAHGYGTLSHNAKAVHQKYLGWYDANPANLNPLPPVENARKTVEYMGGADAVIVRASRRLLAKGEYRWVASAMNQVVFADAANRAARELGADALEQMGYQAEAGPWRDAYLVGAAELRNGLPRIPGVSTANADTIRALGTGQFFDYLGVRLNAGKAEGKTMVINWTFTDSRQQFVTTVENSALTWVAGRQAAKADATITLARGTLDALALGQTTLPEAVKAGFAKVEGDAAKPEELLAMLDTFNVMFEVVEPKKAARR
jgi:alkyl sulfatase BDS1-like metallo-beta-lactamase superfamily hydrolase